MPVKRCGPLKLVKRKKENNTNKTDENCYSSPTKKMKSVNSLNITLFFFFKLYTYNILIILFLVHLFYNIIFYRIQQLLGQIKICRIWLQQEISYSVLDQL